MSKITSQINKYSDEVLCALAAGGCQDAEEELVKRYFRQVRICARPYFLAGGDSEDLIQEAMFGLLKAIREFEPSRDVQFRTFAEVCIRNQIRSAVTSAARSKHAPLNDSVPFEAPMVLRSEISPEELYISREEENERLARLGRQLSVLESNLWTTQSSASGERLPGILAFSAKADANITVPAGCISDSGHQREGISNVRRQDLSLQRVWPGVRVHCR